MLIDLHVHTDRYSTCGRSSPEAMIERAMELGLDALVFTEHNLHWPVDELVALQARYPSVRLYTGTELTSAAGDDFLVYGLTERNRVGAGMEAAEILNMARRQGAAVILAHPYRYRDAVPQEIYTQPVDAIEIMSTNIYNYSHLRAVALAGELGTPSTAASDGHHADMLGLYALEVDHLPEDEHALAELIKSGEMRLRVDSDRIAAQNEVLSREMPAIQSYIGQGLANQELRERLSSYVNLTVIQGVREGRDVMRPWQVPARVASSAS
ncbi:MAG: PHP domain-containing protein [Anaerolineae bacterium]